MKKERSNIQLSSYDDIFGGNDYESIKSEASGDSVVEIPLSDLHPFKDHPFKVRDDEEMAKTVESVKEYGVLQPAIVRADESGGYELISGHRRYRASELAGKEALPCIVKELDDDAATILMVDSNLQREEILPSERAFALKMKMEAMSRQGKRNDLGVDLTSTQVGRKLETAEIIGQEIGESKNQVRRYVRLTNLLPEFLDMVDNKVIGFNPAVEISFLNETQQNDLLAAIAYSQAIPSLSQAQRIKKLALNGEITHEGMNIILSEEKKSELDKVTLKNDVLKRYFPKSYTPKQMEETIIKLLDQWQRKRNRDMSL